MKLSLFSTFLIIIAGLFSQKTLAQTEKKYQGLLWEISKPGESKKSYLYGTMHVSRKISFNLSDTFYLALENADAVGLESAPSEWLESTKNSAYLSFYYGEYPYYIQQQDFYQRNFQFVPPDNRDLGKELSGQNSIINNIQYRNSDQDFEEDTYLDMFIFKTALKYNKPVASLENFQTSTDLYYKASQRLNEEKIEMQKRKTPKWLEDMMEEKSYFDILEDSYREGNLDMIDALNVNLSPSRYNRIFLYTRNKYMAESIDSIISSGNSLFAGIGAAHLPGDEGVIEILRKKGYILRSVTHTQTEISKEKKKQFEDKIKPIVPTLQVSPDNTFKIKLPGKLYEFYTNDDSKQYFSADYANGGYFFINKINMFNFITHLSPKDYALKMDSLLYENIPGKINEKKKITRNGFEGIEIRNTTSTGDAQRYQIYFTPLEIIIFKYGGKNNYIHQWEDTIFNSLELLKSENEKFETQKYYNNEFSILMPSYSIFNHNEALDAIYKQPDIYGFDDKNDAYYFFKKSVFNDLINFEEDKFELEHIAEKFCKRHYYELKSKKLIKVQGYPAIEFTGANGGHSISGRLVINAGKYYFFGTTSKNKSDVSRFLNSFKMEKPSMAFPLNNYSDTTFLFSVTTDTSLNFTNKYFDGIPLYNAYNQKEENDYTEDDEYYYTFFQSVDKDVVRVNYHRFTTYDYFENEDSVFSYLIDEHRVFENAIIAKKSKSEANGIKTMDLEVRDTNTSRNIHVKFILSKNSDAVYVLNSMNDTLSPESDFIKTFYATFTPKDTATGISVFENKAKILLKDIVSKDTATSKKARKTMDEISFGKKDADTIIAFLNTYKFKENEEFLKYDICKKIIGLKSDTILQYAENLYKNNEDNFPIQSVALKIIASQMTEKSTLHLRDILMKDQPLLSVYEQNSYSSSTPTSYLTDSLELLNLLFPEVLKLTENDVYEGYIITWLGYLADSNLIDTGLYAKHLDYFYNKLNSVLKREYAERQFKLMNEKREDANSYSRYGSNYTNDYLQNLLTIILPFRENPKIKELIKDCDLYLNDVDLIAFYKKKLMVSNEYDKSRIDTIAANPEQLVLLYNALKKINKADIIPQKYLTEKHLIYAAIKDDDNYSLKNLDFRKNQPELLKKETVAAKNSDMEIYYFLYDKSKDSKENKSNYYDKKENFIIITVVYKLNQKEKNLTHPYTIKVNEIEDEDRLEDELKDIKNTIELTGRIRATKKDLPLNNSSSYGDYYEDDY